MLQSLLQFVFAGFTAVREENMTGYQNLGDELKIEGLVKHQEECMGGDVDKFKSCKQEEEPTEEEEE